MTDMKPLEKFGRFFVENFRDKSLVYLQFMLDGKWKAPDLQALQNKVSNLSPELKALLCEFTDELLTNGMHDLLFAFQESHDCKSGIEVMVDGKLVAALSDGLHGEIFGEDGWIVRYSKFPAAAESARSRWAEKAIEEMLEDDDDDEVEP
jgi:hypothetical protein